MPFFIFSLIYKIKKGEMMFNFLNPIQVLRPRYTDREKGFLVHKSNLDTYISYYRSYKFPHTSNVLTKIIKALYVEFDDVMMLLTDMDGKSQHQSRLNDISSFNSRGRFKKFQDMNNEVLFIHNDGNINYGYWEDLKPLNVVSVNNGSTDYLHPRNYEPMGKMIITIDIKMMLYQYHFYKKTRGGSASDFVNKYPLTNLIYSMVDITMYNSFLTGKRLRSNNVKGMFIKTDAYFNKYISNVRRVASKRFISYGVLFNYMDLYDSDIKDILKIKASLGFNNTWAWLMVYLPIIIDLLSFNNKLLRDNSTNARTELINFITANYKNISIMDTHPQVRQMAIEIRNRIGV
jgi:hypothetical protein